LDSTSATMRANSHPQEYATALPLRTTSVLPPAGAERLLADVKSNTADDLELVHENTYDTPDVAHPKEGWTWGVRDGHWFLDTTSAFRGTMTTYSIVAPVDAGVIELRIRLEAA